ncbi:disks large-associated protein 5-like [Hyposmocoma kahamanoa]|uniref:disks large-associated protein 5-like n=1 Tax=Hyposmocoma kahamanoa TaxID=1477025 RepID=UPI000E6D8FD6|nr:disks large-associated protein 5-like [Hyposmocoma kahamanoa]
MDKLFDLSALLRNNEKKHKSKPLQFMSVSGGVEKRLQSNIKTRKSNRLTVFDSIRNLPRCESPLPAVSEAKLKVEHRRQQLEKWKAEKEEKKKQQVAQKKKPFIAGVVRAPLKFEPPPPPPKPSTSGRVTRSQARNTISKPKSPKQGRAQSFAPKNATFKAPHIKTLEKLPILSQPPKNKNRKKTTITFDPVAPHATAKQTRSKTQTRQTNTDIKNTHKSQFETRSTRGKTNILTKNTAKSSRFTKNPQSSSSGSDIETSKMIKKVTNTGQNKTSKPISNGPKALVFESTTDGTSSDNSSQENAKLKSKYSIVSVNSSASESEKISSDTDSSIVRDSTVIRRSTRKSFFLPKHFSPGNSGSGNTSSDVEFVSETICSGKKKYSRKPLPSTPIVPVPKSESKSEEKLRSPKSPIDLVLTPEQIQIAKISPCVTMSRGKDKARKEAKWKMQEGLLDADASDMENVDHFRHQLSSEIKRITEMCNAWEAISETTVLPESVQEAVLAAVGQARLLMSQKMAQFASLVERCARPETGCALVTPADLHGFWDMVFMQVDNVNMRFKKLEELRSRDWVEEKPQAQTKKKTVGKPVVAKKVAATASSSLKDMIAAKRRALQQRSPAPAPWATADKTFVGGFFQVTSPVRSPRAPAASLRRSVLASEAGKCAAQNATPFAMLRASIFGKNVDCQDIVPLQQTPQMNPINFNATPGRSILKSANSKSGKKSIKVLFNDSNYEARDSFTSCDKSKSSFEGVEEIENINSVISLIDFDNKENSQTGIKSKRLVRQDAVEGFTSGIMTRSQSKSLNTPQTHNEEQRRSSRKNKAESKDTPSKTPRQSRKKKDEATPRTEKRSSKKKILQEIEDDVQKTPRRTSRRSKVQDLLT